MEKDKVEQDWCCCSSGEEVEESEETSASAMSKPTIESHDNRSSSEEDESDGSTGIHYLMEMFAKKLGLSSRDELPAAQVLDEVNFRGVVNYIKMGKCRNIIVMTGAGTSTSAGIPDFRSPGSGLYDNLQKYNLPHPQAIFEISFFQENPEPFYTLAKELYPGKFKPTICHYFIRLLHEKQMLLRLYTQNIDTLDRIAGIPEEKLVEAHGTFFTSHCINSKCRKEYSLQWMKDQIFADKVPKCTECNKVVKPDIVFFGENLPSKFYACSTQDFSNCDLLIVMGTSLAVQPFASLVNQVPPTTPRLLINKEKAGETDSLIYLMGFDGGLKFDSRDNYRDVAWLGLCDDGCQALADALDWGEELKGLVEKEHKLIESAEQDNQTDDAKLSVAAAAI